MVSGFGSEWSAWTQVNNNGTIPPSIANAEYLQYSITFTTTDPSVSALLSSILFNWT
jgi:hypothetical protein